jgi:DNA-directed RNA polymerase specialized sigma subunit
MAWYCEYLLKNQNNIREAIINSRDAKSFIPDRIIEFDFNDDTYNDLLVLEKTIEVLRNTNNITNQEYKIIELIKNNTNIKEIENLLGLGRITIYRIFSDTCERIAYVLGGEFSNNGFIDKIQREYPNLTENQLERIKNYFEKNTVEKFL